MLDPIVAAAFDGELQTLRWLLRMRPKRGEGLFAAVGVAIAPAQQEHVGPIGRGGYDDAGRNLERLRLGAGAANLDLVLVSLDNSGVILFAFLEHDFAGAQFV